MNKRNLILGTAGHIDHGKTSLIRALTGIDCDRLPEEKARGITIDIGFAHFTLGPLEFGIVDVPGHERFIKNMLAGTTGIDLVLLAVSAKESIKPQTVEHLEILKLLGVQQGVIAITMIDLVDTTTQDIVEMEVKELVRGSFLENAAIIRTSAITGEGISTIREQLENTAKQVQVKKSESWFRLAIDRAFSVQGYGTVVTGTVISGSCRTGEELAWLPSGEMIRVRHLQRHEQPVNEIHSGMRAAMNLAGVKLEEVARGQELATPGYLIPSKVLTVHLHNLPHAKRTLKHRTSIRLHLGTDELIGKVSLLDCDQLEPGSWALSQLFLEKPALATFGQSFIIRDPSATITFGGGRILQPAPDKIRRRHISYLERIEKLLDDADPQKHAMEVAWFCGNKGVSVADLVRGSTLTPAEAESTIKQGLEDGKLFNLQIHETKSYIIHHETLNETQSKVKEVLQELHVKHPLMATHDRCLVGLRLSYLADDDFIQAIIDNMLKNNLLEGNKKRIALVGHVPKMSINQRKLKEKILHKFYDMKYQPPDISNFVAQAGGNVNSLKDILQVCVAEGELVQIAEDVYLHTEHERNLYKFLKEAFKTGTGLTVATIRDILGTTRKYAVPLCEYLDRLGITRREGDLRYLIDNKP